MTKRKRIVNIVTLCLLACIAVGAFIMARLARDRAAAIAEESIKVPPAVGESAYTSEMVVPNVEKRTFEGKDYYLFRGTYAGDYDMQFRVGCEKETAPDGIDTCRQMDYAEYCEYCADNGLTQKYTDESKRYLVCSVSADGVPNVDARLAAVEYCEDSAELYILSNFEGVTADTAAFICVVPTDRDVKNVRHVSLCPDENFENILKFGVPYDPYYEPEPEKPIIYLYPEEETDVTVALGHPECITHSYPVYDGPWQVSAQPDGTLTDLETGRQLYCLYYENVSPVPLLQTEEGFVVRGEDAAAFLEEKLAILGLSEREAEEFIIYWLPRLEENEWNYIRFADRAEIDAEMPLEISPQPDSVIRVLMLYKPLDAPVPVTEQTLTTPARTGFTAVEWGGAELS